MNNQTNQEFSYRWTCSHCDAVSLSSDKPTSFGKSDHQWTKHEIIGVVEDA